MQGFNMGRYVPPDHEGLISGNALQNKNRSHKPLTVRFEMPYPIWCATCPKPTLIPQGVRFNAQKTKTGNYYHSTPIFSFTIKHTICSGIIIIQTDPKNTDYKIISGARRQTLSSEGIQTPREQQESKATAISLLEKTILDRESHFNSSLRIEELKQETNKHWDDPYEQNARLRKAFRVGRHDREKQAATAQNLQDRMSLGIDLLPETKEDAQRAALVDFAPTTAADSSSTDRRVLAKPLFDGKNNDNSKEKKNKKMLKSAIATQKLKANLVSEIVSNTRAARDPFLDFGNTASRSAGGGGGGLLPGLKKRKRALDDKDVRETTISSLELEKEEQGLPPTTAAGRPHPPLALVNYNSDSD
ncbi:hypothetical protein QBC38DRAFT_462940 [Podospora fimiseda]|uniref:Coiled-coil domain-containing protein n=1 Tax=Podospora fimiseda TaxID=252190 RepID=A0AAN7BZG5_9PEZI|nr:hypothetical protein QBC38DRAFT_462940 [Podospora fimiseda]